MDAVSKAGGAVVLRQEGGGVEEKFPGRGGKYLKIFKIPQPVGNSRTLHVTFYDLSMTLNL